MIPYYNYFHNLASQPASKIVEADSSFQYKQVKYHIEYNIQNDFFFFI